MTAKKPQEGTKLIPGNLHVAEDCRAVSEVLARVGAPANVRLACVRAFLARQSTGVDA